MLCKYLKTLLALLSCLAFACGCAGSSGSDSESNEQAMKCEAGYYELGPIPYTLKLGKAPVDRNASQARIFYSYHPGDEIVAVGETSQPLFVFLNGGPGCATTLNLFAMNTAPYTLDKERTGGDLYADNPYSWTTMGNLLYIDAPNTGFSYNNTPLVKYEAMRFTEFVNFNYNPYIDAAQVIRTILRFLDEHENIGANDIVLVGESYGGTRVSTMLNMLLFREKYTTERGWVYQDDELARLIEKHFDKYFHGKEVTSELVASQFGRQILIEPQLTGPYQDEVTEEAFLQPDSIIHQLAKEEGKVWNDECKDLEVISLNSCLILGYVPEVLNRDPYIYTKNKTWSDEVEAHSTQALLDVDALSTVLGVDVRSIGKILPSERKNACRISPIFSRLGEEDEEFGIDLEYAAMFPPQLLALLKEMLKSVNYTESLIDRDKDNSLDKVLGKLKSWDSYLMGTNLSVFVAFSMFSWHDEYSKVISPDMSTLFGEMFLNNLALVKTFLTDAELDLVIYSPALPPSFKKYTGIVKDVKTVRGKDDQDRQHPGSVTISFLPDSLADVETTPESRTIYYPYYASSGHSVSSAQPDEFRQDVMNWLEME